MRDRRVQRGSALLPQCADEFNHPKLTRNEYGSKDDRVYCYGLEDSGPGILNEECRTCGALVWNAKPLEGQQ